MTSPPFADHRPPSGARVTDAAAARRERDRCRFVAALGLIGGEPDPFTDAVAGTAASIANTPMAVVSLLDEHRQWFLGSWGVETRDAPRSMSFCTHAILRDAPLVVEDALRDARFENHPAVNGELHVRFYAGFPLVVGGHAVGVLCVADDHPRRLSPCQFDRLATLAEGTVAWLAKRRHAKAP